MQTIDTDVKYTLPFIACKIFYVQFISERMLKTGFVMVIGKLNMFWSYKCIIFVLILHFEQQMNNNNNTEYFSYYKKKNQFNTYVYNLHICINSENVLFPDNVWHSCPC